MTTKTIYHKTDIQKYTITFLTFKSKTFMLYVDGTSLTTTRDQFDLECQINPSIGNYLFRTYIRNIVFHCLGHFIGFSCRSPLRYIFSRWILHETYYSSSSVSTIFTLFLYGSCFLRIFRLFSDHGNHFIFLCFLLFPFNQDFSECTHTLKVPECPK